MNPKKIFFVVFLSFISPFLIALLIGILFLKNIYGKTLPNVYLNKTYFGRITYEEAYKKLEKINLPQKLTLTFEKQNFDISFDAIEIQINKETTVNNLFKIGRTGDLLNDIKSFFNNKNISVLDISFDEENLKKEIGIIAENITTEVIYPQIYIENNEIFITNGQIGTQIDVNDLTNQIRTQLSNENFEPISVNLKEINTILSEEQIQEILLKAKKINNKKIVLKYENNSFEIINLALFIDPNAQFLTEKINSEVQKISSQINTDSQNPVFQFENNKVIEFKPAITGIKVKENETSNKILQALMLLSQNNDENIFIDIPVEITNPDYKTEEVNNLGIKELLSTGTSKFVGSISSRVYNISLAASRVSGHLVAPNEIFSFNQAVGDISALSGYKEAYVIKDGKTTLGDGGGVCQVSTTLFRAALNAGLPILERKSHSYRVGYYEQDAAPGLDATIYSPITDFKFKNDTNNYILVQAIFDGKNSTLKFEIYGTSDGRKVTLTKPILYDQAPPPEDLYVDEPTLPIGTIKQVEYKAWGGKSKFDYIVEKDGKIIFEKTFYSSYRPWGAVFLKGTGGQI